MGHVYLIPQWFIFLSVFMKIFITLVSLGISFLAFRIYNLYKQRELRLFGIGFLLISISYIFRFSIDVIIFFSMDLKSNVVNISNITNIGSILFALYFLFFIVGLSTLAYITLRTRNKRAYLFIIVFSLLAVALSAEKAPAFFIVAGFLFFSLVLHYLINYFEKKNNKILFSLVAFFLLVLSRAAMFLSSQGYAYYIIGHILEFSAYFLLLANLVLITKNGQKKK